MFRVGELKGKPRRSLQVQCWVQYMRGIGITYVSEDFIVVRFRTEYVIVYFAADS